MKIPIWDSYKKRKAKRIRLENLLLMKPKTKGDMFTKGDNPGEGALFHDLTTSTLWLFYKGKWIKASK